MKGKESGKQTHNKTHQHKKQDKGHRQKNAHKGHKTQSKDIRTHTQDT